MRENSLEFVVEALSAWPILAAIGALREFFHRALG